MRRLLVALILMKTALATAGTIEQVTKADCVGAGGATLRLNRAASSLDVHFPPLPPMGNEAEGQRGPIEVTHDINGSGRSGIGSLVIAPNNYWGSAFLTAGRRDLLQEQTSLQAVFLDAGGRVIEKTLNCRLQFQGVSLL